MFSNLGTATANASASTTAGDASLLQYEWPQLSGDQSFNRFSAGPAPESPDILWKTPMLDIQPYIVAFNGKVFVTTSTAIFALDKDTGRTVWTTNLPGLGQWSAVYKIDDNRLIVGQYCLETETGKIFWTANNNFTTTNVFAPGFYSPTEKMFYNKGKSMVQAWDFSDPSKPPVLAWEAYVPGGGSPRASVVYGDGNVFPDSYDGRQIALNARTGAVVWDTQTTGSMVFSCSYYDGKVLRGGVDNQFYAFDAKTGKILWVYNPGTEFGSWAYGTAAAYGLVYELNTDGHLYALDVNTGELVWKYAGPGYIFFPGNPIVADGKVYVTIGQAQFKDPVSGMNSQSEFACIDAYTGQLLWSLPIEAYAPRESTAIAYGNLYLLPGYMENSTDIYVPLNQVWAIGTQSWSMFRQDPTHSGAGQAAAPTNLTVRWKFTTGGAVCSSPSVVNGILYVGSEDKKLYALDAETGGLLWTYQTGAAIESSPAVADGKVYLGPDDGNVYSLDALTGKLIWKTPVGGYIEANFDSMARLISSPTVVDGKVYIGSLDKNLYCLDANTGSVKWTFETLGYITSSPAVIDGAVYFTSQEPNFGALYKLDADNGTRVWKLETPYTYILENGTDMQASPSVADGMVFSSSNKYERYGVDAATGRIVWTYQAVNMKNFQVDSIAYHDGDVFFADQFFMACVNAATGKVIWKSWIGSALNSSPTYADGKVYVVSDQKSIYVLNATDGTRLSWFATGSKSWSSPTIYESKLYVGNSDWNVYCLAEDPVQNSNLTINLAKTGVNLSESVTGSGQLTPGMTNTTVYVNFIRPDGTMDYMQTATADRGVFNFSYTPDVAGNWTVIARWESTEGRYSSTYSSEVRVEVTGGLSIPATYFFAVIPTVALVVVAAVLIAHRRRAK